MFTRGKGGTKGRCDGERKERDKMESGLEETGIVLENRDRKMLMMSYLCNGLLN